MTSQIALQPLSLASSRRSNKAVVTGRILSGIATAFLLFDLTGKFLAPQPVIDATVKLGWPLSTLPLLGAILLVCTVLYLIPRTALVGAVLMTGYLGGAVATHLRANGSAFEIMFPILFASIAWGGLYLRDARVGAMIAPAGKNN